MLFSPIFHLLWFNLINHFISHLVQFHLHLQQRSYLNPSMAAPYSLLTRVGKGKSGSCHPPSLLWDYLSHFTDEVPTPWPTLPLSLDNVTAWCSWISLLCKWLEMRVSYGMWGVAEEFRLSGRRFMSFLYVVLVWSRSCYLYLKWPYLCKNGVAAYEVMSQMI